MTSDRREPRAYASTGPIPRRLLVGSERLADLMGRYLLVGVTLRTPDGRLLERRQCHGVVVAVRDGVVVVRHADGETALPAEPDAYRPAPPGVYRLADGDVVQDPDVLATWEVVVVEPDAPA